MQGGAPATFTLTGNSYLMAGSGENGKLYVNGVFYADITNMASFSYTFASGTTFYFTGSGPFGCTYDYTLNGAFQTSYYGNPNVTTPTFTGVGGNTYYFQTYGSA